MKGILVRVAIDSTCGHWNGPIDPVTNDFVYVPIPERKKVHPHLKRYYEEIVPALEKMKVPLKSLLNHQLMHLDPDFEHLTYGDKWPRLKPLLNLKSGDFVAFYSSLKSLKAYDEELIYALIGFFEVQEIIQADKVTKDRWHENAHTRRVENDRNIIVRAKKESSGRLTRAIPIGELRDRAYRVRMDILEAWGGLSVKDGYIHRSANLPNFLKPEKFLEWFAKQNPKLVAKNNIESQY